MSLVDIDITERYLLLINYAALDNEMSEETIIVCKSIFSNILNIIDIDDFDVCLIKIRHVVKYIMYFKLKTQDEFYSNIESILLYTSEYNCDNNKIHDLLDVYNSYIHYIMTSIDIYTSNE